MKTFNAFYKIIFLTSFCIFSNHHMLQAEIIIKEAETTDLAQIIQLDCNVSFEYFKPIYQQYYSEYDFGKNPDYYLDQELILDIETFHDYINHVSPKYGFLVARDTNINNIVGLLLFHQEDISTGYLDLFLIHKDYRKQGIGRALFYKAMEHFSDMKQWIVEPMQLGNEATLKFYNSLGFVNYGPSQDNRLNHYGVPVNQIYFHFVKSMDATRRFYIQRKISACPRR